MPRPRNRSILSKATIARQGQCDKGRFQVHVNMPDDKIERDSQADPDDPDEGVTPVAPLADLVGAPDPYLGYTIVDVESDDEDDDDVAELTGPMLGYDTTQASVRCEDTKGNKHLREHIRKCSRVCIYNTVTYI